MLMAAAWSRVSGGASRVFTVPERGAFAITARAHWPARVMCEFPGSRIAYDMVGVGIALNRTPVGELLVQCGTVQNSRSFFADGVLIPAIVLEIDGTPRLGVDERGEVRNGHDFGLTRFAVFAGWGRGEPGEQPHTAQRDASAKAGGWFGDKTSSAGFENAEDLAEDSLAVANDEEEAGDNDGVDGVGR